MKSRTNLPEFFFVVLSAAVIHHPDFAFASATSNNPAHDEAGSNATLTDIPMNSQPEQPAPPTTQPTGNSEPSPVNLRPAEGSKNTETAFTGDGSVAPVKTSQTRVPNDFGGIAPLPGTRREMAPGEAPEFYEVEAGDTMFDICSQLIDDGNFWPKLWSINPEVKNPHFIYPGMKMAFYPGNSESPPYLEVVTVDEMLPVETGIAESELIADKAPPAGNEGGSTIAGSSQPQERNMENAPTLIVGPDDIANDSDGYIEAGRKSHNKDLAYSIPAFVFADKLPALATIVSGSSGQMIIGDDRSTFIQPIDQLEIGTYSVVRPSNFVSSTVDGSDIGYRYEFCGNIRLTRQMKNGLMQGIVFGTQGSVANGDLVVQFMATKGNIVNASSIGPLSSSKSSIIGFSEAGKSTAGTGDFILLEKRDMSVGGFYPIFATDTNTDLSHHRDSLAGSDKGQSAIVRVVDIIGESALGFIVESKSEVRIGDRVSLE
jgi:LysM domain